MSGLAAGPRQCWRGRPVCGHHFACTSFAAMEAQPELTTRAWEGRQRRVDEGARRHNNQAPQRAHADTTARCHWVGMSGAAPGPEIASWGCSVMEWSEPGYLRRNGKRIVGGAGVDMAMRAGLLCTTASLSCLAPAAPLLPQLPLCLGEVLPWCPDPILSRQAPPPPSCLPPPSVSSTPVVITMDAPTPALPDRLPPPPRLVALPPHHNPTNSLHHRAGLLLPNLSSMSDYGGAPNNPEP
ncbi:hypothetical protein PR202_gb02989 [Eleusine coracana subsp. coracana]|uniref:Uncharacterized protein n=1 Tax=Eleusine coracana subsp. coracana TaxID=191504 RepID=A0AAV5E0V8_ELECO|nr:hypothetical protein PR202_gb02989 [Eleusine coracana subsp. coracana]